MRLLRLYARLACLWSAGGFVLRAPGASRQALHTIASAFDSFRAVPGVRSVTVHASPEARGGGVCVAAHLVCDHGFETWASGRGAGIGGACEDCVNDGFLMVALRHARPSPLGDAKLARPERAPRNCRRWRRLKQKARSAL